MFAVSFMRKHRVYHVPLQFHWPHGKPRYSEQHGCRYRKLVVYKEPPEIRCQGLSNLEEIETTHQYQSPKLTMQYA